MSTIRYFSLPFPMWVWITERWHRFVKAWIVDECPDDVADLF